MRGSGLKFFGTAFALSFVCMRIGAAERSITELTPLATFSVGKTADWVAITADAVWVASTGPFAVHRIDPKTNTRIASVALPGEPCAGLVTGSGSLWVPLCTAKPSLAKIDLESNTLASVYTVGPPAEEGGIAFGAASIWLIVDKFGSLARINPASGAVIDTFHVPAGSYNPVFLDGRLGDACGGVGVDGHRCRDRKNHCIDRNGAESALSHGGQRCHLDSQSRRRHFDPHRCTQQARNHHPAGHAGSWWRYRPQRRQSMDHHAQSPALAH